MLQIKNKIVIFDTNKYYKNKLSTPNNQQSLINNKAIMNHKKLSTDNPEQLSYTHGMLQIDVLGGIKLDGLDRLRVTLRIKVEHLILRHNLDLYNDTQTEKLIRKVAARLEIGTSVIEAALIDLTNHLEHYRLEQIKSQRTEHQHHYTLSEKEKEAALQLLKSPDLLNKTNALIGQSGVIGEENNRLLMYLIFTSRKREQPLHIVSLGASGTGKTHLQEKVADLIPQEDKIEVTSLSENAFYYFGQRELKNKLILIEDLDGAENVLYPLRELQTKKKISKTIVHKNTKGETKSINLIVEGPVSVSGCTTKESIYEDNANRSFLIYLDESPTQTELIMDYQRKQSAGKVNTKKEKEAATLLKNTQRVLEPIKVINPYAELLKLPTAVLKPRRSNTHYLQFIELVTYYHQCQRHIKYDKTTGEAYIETTIDDIKEANHLLKDILLRKSDTLTGACRNYFEGLKAHLKEQKQSTFGNREIRQALKVNASNQKRYNLQLIETSLIEKVKGKPGTPYTYKIITEEDYKALWGSITNVLDDTLNQIIKQAHKPPNKQQPITDNQKTAHGSDKTASDPSTGSKAVHTPNEPPKPKKTNKKKRAVH